MAFPRPGKQRNTAAYHAGHGAPAVLVLAAKVRRHAGQVSVRYSDHYEKKGLFHRLMERLRSTTQGDAGLLPVLAAALRC